MDINEFAYEFGFSLRNDVNDDRFELIVSVGMAASLAIMVSDGCISPVGEYDDIAIKGEWSLEDYSTIAIFKPSLDGQKTLRIRRHLESCEIGTNVIYGMMGLSPNGRITELTVS